MKKWGTMKKQKRNKKKKGREKVCVCVCGGGGEGQRKRRKKALNEFNNMENNPCDRTPGTERV